MNGQFVKTNLYLELSVKLKIYVSVKFRENIFFFNFHFTHSDTRTEGPDDFPLNWKELPGFLENSFNLIDIFGPSDDSYWLRTNALRYQRLAIYEIRIQIHHQVDDRRRTMHICIRSGHSVTCCFVAQSLNLFAFVLSYTNTQCVKRISISINAMWP